MVASVHRLPGAEVETPRFGPAPLHRGERTTCPGCGKLRTVQSMYTPTIVSGPSRGALCDSWWDRFLRGCKERRRHYHQRCLACGARWIVGFLEEIE